ncbi:MAG TPA: YdcH family protein [Terricaulis sp.]|nr:YdcH family protein [Terricaulis sp.]
MSNTPHTLGDEFPDQMEQIHALKVANASFAKLLLNYDTVNDKIHRAETNIEPVSNDIETEWRKQRLALKDQIARALAESS